MEQVAPNTNSSSVNSALVATLDSQIHPALQRILEQAVWQTASCFSPQEFLALSEKSQWLWSSSLNRDSASYIKVLQPLRPALSSERTFVIVIAEQPSTGDAILCIQDGAMAGQSFQPSCFSRLIALASSSYRRSQSTGSKRRLSKVMR
jgi:DNA-binding NtrC family response regulator